MQTPETRFHSWLFALLIGLVTIVSGKLVPYLESVPWWSFVGGGVLIALISKFGYGALATRILEMSEKWDWLLTRIVGKSYVKGYWVGYLKKSSGSYVMAIERFDQTPSSLKAVGESLKPDGDRGAEWKSESASVDPSGPFISIYYSTNVSLGEAGQTRDTAGFGRLRVDNDRITGSITDKPELQTQDGQDQWLARGVEYKLRKVTSVKARSFDEAKKTAEWQEMRQELAGISDEWAESATEATPPVEAHQETAGRQELVHA